jgi:hypothetical protein
MNHPFGGYRRLTRMSPILVRATSVSTQTANNQRIFDAIAIVLTGLLSVSYFVTAVKFASVRPFWMDEVLSIWTARLPTVTAVWDALEKGSDFSPPLYILLLQKIIQLGAGSALMLRLPSILAVYVVGIAAFILMRRYYSPPLAALAMAICLVGGLFPFALEAHAYACVAACIGLVLVIWDVPPDRAPSLWRAVAILVLLAIAIGMHFYAVLIAAAVGMMELVWAAPCPLALCSGDRAGNLVDLSLVADHATGDGVQPR